MISIKDIKAFFNANTKPETTMNIGKVMERVLPFVGEHHIKESLRSLYSNDQYLVATDGNTLVELDLNVYPDLKDVQIAENKNFPDWKKVMPETTESRRIKIETLRTPDNLIPDPDPPQDTPCKECKGKGYLPHDCGCEHCVDKVLCLSCDGYGEIRKGEISANLVYTVIDGQYYNPKYMNRIVDLFEVLEIENAWLDYGEGDQHLRTLALSDHGVTCLCMPVYPTNPDIMDVVKEVEITEAV